MTDFIESLAKVGAIMGAVFAGANFVNGWRDRLPRVYVEQTGFGDDELVVVVVRAVNNGPAPVRIESVTAPGNMRTDHIHLKAGTVKDLRYTDSPTLECDLLVPPKDDLHFRVSFDDSHRRFDAVIKRRKFWSRRSGYTVKIRRLG